jgi:hypothetical protein
MLHPLVRLGLLAAAIAVAVAALRFYRGQAKKRGLGGRSSIPRIAWLFWCIYTWFLVCPIVALDPALAPAPRMILGAFAGFMWLRGLAELYLIYRAKAWKPSLGIGHDFSCLALIAGLAAWNADALMGVHAPPDRWALALVGAVLASLCVEILHAALFSRAAAGRTPGEHGIWFAEGDPRIVFVNRVTTTFNVPLYAFLVAFLVAAVGLWP